MKHLFCYLILVSFSSFAQRFTFADTYPTNNVDSLENWLKTHPQPTEERLKNLIRLARTYIFIESAQKNHHISEITQLAQRFNNPSGKLIGGRSIDDLQQALAGFEALRDTSGIINTLATMAGKNYGSTFLPKGDDYSAEEYLRRAKQLLKARFNAHDYFMVVTYGFFYQAGKANSDHEAILASSQEALRLCESQNKYQYAWLTTKSHIAIIHYYRQDYVASYTTNKEVLARLKPHQRLQKLVVTQNIANDCEFLGRYDERLALCQDIAKQIRIFPQNVRPYDYLNFYISFKEEMDRRGRYREASQYGDSIMMIQDTIYNMERKQKLIEFQAEHKQNQISELTLQQTQTENRNRFILTLLGIAVVVALALTYLGLRLRQSNVRLNALVQLRDEFIRIIAHDLRRPLHAFYGLSEVFGKLLQRGDQQAILTLSQSIDQSGLYIRQMLDNLLYWALAQKDKLAINMTTFELHPHLVTHQMLYKGVTAKQGIEIRLSCPPDLTVHTDVNALDLILRNLLDNAIQHTPPQGVVQLVASPTPTGGVQIQIIDSGKGMNLTQLTLVREVLERPSCFQPKQQNLGLGLIIVGTFAKQLGINISVESQEGVGTTFWIKLPKED